jgi:hypothetical protein
MVRAGRGRGTVTVSGTDPVTDPATASGAARGPAPVAPGRPTGIGPAAVVAIVAVVVVAVFTVLALVADNGPKKPAHRVTGPVSGTSLQGVPGRAALGPLVSGGEPPANVVAAVAVPAGTTRTSVSNRGAGVGQYDQSAHFEVRATQAELYDFFRTEMRRAGFTISAAGPGRTPRDLQVLGKMAGDDGWYWEMGATVSPTTFANTAAGPGTGPATTPFTIRLYQVSDES